MRTIRLRLLAAAATLLTGLAAVLTSAVVVPPAQAAGPTSVSLVGSGWGHGRGMSQYGAQNAARNHARTATQILDFYYPGTVSAPAAGPMVVLITADTSSNVVVEHRSGLMVRSVKTGATWSLARAGAKQWQITPVSGNTVSRVSVLTDRWRVVRDIPGEAEFGAGTSPLKLILPSGSAVYRGRLRSIIAGTSRDTANVVDLEDYLKGVVPVEIPALWHPQAVQAQSVAARTYAVFARTNPHPPGYHLCDTSACQVYRGVAAEHSASTAAIAATKSQIRAYGGKPAFTQFSSSNGGWTVQGSPAYLPAKADPYDVWSGNPNAQWKVTLTDLAIEKAYPATGDFLELSVLKRDGKGSWGGRVTEIRIRGAKGSATVTGDAFRAALRLKSTMFACSPVGSTCRS